MRTGRPKLKVALLITAIGGLIVLVLAVYQGWSARKDDQLAQQYFDALLADCITTHNSGPVSGSLTVHMCTLPESVEPLIRMGRRAEPTLRRLGQSTQLETKEKEIASIVACTCAMLVTGSDLERQPAGMRTGTSVVLIHYSFTTRIESESDLERAWNWLKATARNLVRRGSG